jgi:hypothetical protein
MRLAALFVLGVILFAGISLAISVDIWETGMSIDEWSALQGSMASLSPEAGSWDDETERVHEFSPCVSHGEGEIRKK